jgi:hypothetical protein
MEALCLKRKWLSERLGFHPWILIDLSELARICTATIGLGDLPDEGEAVLASVVFLCKFQTRAPVQSGLDACRVHFWSAKVLHFACFL